MSARAVSRWETAGGVFAIVAIIAVVALAAIGGHKTHGALIIDWPRRPTDLETYRNGARAFLAGRHIYDPDAIDPTSFGVHAPFTYPPIAAVVFVPLAAVPLPLATLTMLAVSVLLMAWIVRIIARHIGFPAVGQWTWPLAAAVLALVLWMEPVRTTLILGQINIILTALVIADTLMPRTGRSAAARGLLIGIAAAIKLVPAVFLVYFLVRRDWRGARNVVLGFLATTALGWAIAPGLSWQYWTHTLYSTDRIGSPAYLYNQGIQGPLARGNLQGHDLSLWWAGLSLLAVIALSAAAWYFGRASLLLCCVAAVAGIDYLATPASWVHHWILMSPLVLALAVWAYRARSRVLAVVAALGVLTQLPGGTAVLPQLKDVEKHWNPVQMIYGNAYLIWFVIAVIALLWYAHRGGTEQLPQRSQEPATASHC